MGTTSKVLWDKGQAKPTADLGRQAVEEISTQLRQLLADVFALYLKTKNFHWHMAGRHFRDYHLLLDEQAEQIFAMTDNIAERSRKIGGTNSSLHRRCLQESALEGQRSPIAHSRRNAL